MAFLCSVGGMHALLNAMFVELGIDEEEKGKRQQGLLDALQKELHVQMERVPTKPETYARNMNTCKTT